MSVVGSTNRTGWIEEPNCQACHVGSATNRLGVIRYVDALTTGGVLRAAAEPLFATSSNTPAAGLSLYRFSTGHGGLQCAACHGSTHAEFPSAVASDNAQHIAVQGHAGTMIECQACHGTQPSTVSGGPHGMHPIGQNWARNHADAVQGSGGPAQCKACHGSDYRGTVLSRSQMDRTLSTKFGSRTFWRGFQISCYNCHNGPNSSDAVGNTAAVVTGGATSTPAGVAVSMTLPASDANGNALTLRVVDQPAHGSVALTGATATYYPEAGWTGTNRFTFSAWDGYTDSNLGAMTVVVYRVDADADGVPDWWTQLHFGHAAGQADDQSRAGDDPDGDGLSNAQEQQAGTDPADGRNGPRLVSIGRAGTNVTGRFSTALGQHFIVQRATDPAGPWQNVGGERWGHQDSVPFADGGATGALYRLVAP